LVFAEEGDADSAAARKAMDATHQKIVDHYYSKDYLLKGHYE
jgi:hypothetical protein